MTPKHFILRLLSVILTVSLLTLGVNAEQSEESTAPTEPVTETEETEEASDTDGDGDTEPEPPDRVPVAYGIDVSRWQGEVDFAAVKASGVDFVLLRTGYWDVKDVNFDTYYENARGAGLDIGVYLYSYSESVEDAAYEAECLLSWIKGKTLEYPVYYDIEDECQSQLTGAERTALCLSFARVIAEAGYLPGVYANETWFNKYLVRDSIAHLPLWIAKWTDDGAPSPDPGEPYGMWQYTARGTVDGVTNSVDRNVSYVDYPAYIRENGLSGYAEIPFTDVARSAWYYEYVKYTYDNGLMGGMSPTVFSPEVSVTRGMFVTVLGRMSGAQVDIYTESSFLDVDMTAYYGPYVCWAYENGITDGMGRDMFSPDTLITREQMCKMMAGYLAFTGVALTPAAEPFTDDALISDWAREYVYLLCGAGVINGVGPGVFSPKTDATRAQCAAIIMRVNELE